jgi:hypothetical protein
VAASGRLADRVSSGFPAVRPSSSGTQCVGRLASSTPVFSDVGRARSAPGGIRRSPFVGSAGSGITGRRRPSASQPKVPECVAQRNSVSSCHQSPPTPTEIFSLGHVAGRVPMMSRSALDGWSMSTPERYLKPTSSSPAVLSQPSLPRVARGRDEMLMPTVGIWRCLSSKPLSTRSAPCCRRVNSPISVVTNRTTASRTMDLPSEA